MAGHQDSWLIVLREGRGEELENLHSTASVHLQMLDHVEDGFDVTLAVRMETFCLRTVLGDGEDRQSSGPEIMTSIAVWNMLLASTSRNSSL